MKKFLIAGNWKMNKTIAEAKEFADALAAKNFANAEEVAILAPFTQLVTLGESLKGSGIGFETVNNVHKKVCSTAERQTYSANVGQEVFDTDLGKKLIYIGSGWYDLMGNPVD